MAKPVDKTEFWKERLETASSLHYSVYVASEPLWKAINETHEEIFNKEIPKDAKVLDAGCAYGRWANRFDDYVGIDFSPDFIEKAKELYPNKEFMVADLKALPFKDKEFDWSICVSIKNMIVSNLGKETWDIMESELKRVSKHVLLLEYGNEKPREGIIGANVYEIL